MKFGHEKLDVYKVSLQYVKWVFEIADRLTGKFRHSRDHLLRASQSITYNISKDKIDYDNDYDSEEF